MTLYRPYKISDEDRASMKIGITQEFSERYGMSIPETVDLFESNDIYDYLDGGADQFIHRMYPFMANYIAERLGIPVIRRSNRPSGDQYSDNMDRA